MTGILVIAVAGSGSVGTTESDARVAESSSTTAAPLAADRRAPVGRACPSARKAVKFYAGRIAYWRDQMGADSKTRPASRGHCPRYLAKVLRAKAHALGKWVRYHYFWWEWMPAKHQRVAACETGHQGGTGPGGSRWDWDSGTYVSAFGIYRAGYNDDAHRAGNLGWDETIAKLGRYPTPREQMQAADAHRARWGGWSGWGCRGA